MRSATTVLVFGIVVVAATFNGTSYARNATLHDNLDIYWTVDTGLGIFRVAVHVTSASGWVGFGFSEMGGMEGSDIVYFESTVRAFSQHIFEAAHIETYSCCIVFCQAEYILLRAMPPHFRNSAEK